MVSIKNVGFVALCAAATAFAQGKPSQPSMQQGQMQQGQMTQQVQPPKDAKALLEDLHQANQDEIQLGQTAESKAQSREAKDVAQQIVRDHQQLDQQVTQLAQQMKVTLGKPPSPSGKFEKQLKTLSKDFKDTLNDAQGQTFDTLYLSNLVVEHGNDLQMLWAAQAKFQSDPQVSKLLSSAIPVISRHQQLAAQALSQLVQQNRAVGGAGMQGGDFRGSSQENPSSPSGY